MSVLSPGTVAIVYAVHSHVPIASQSTGLATKRPLTVYDGESRVSESIHVSGGGPLGGHPSIRGRPGDFGLLIVRVTRIKEESFPSPLFFPSECYTVSLLPSCRVAELLFGSRTLRGRRADYFMAPSLEQLRSVTHRA